MEKKEYQQELENISNIISNSIQKINIKYKNIMPAKKHKEIYKFLTGINYGVFLLMKYIERDNLQPYEKFIEEELIKEFNL